MTVQIALLRAINVGGRSKVSLADLRQIFAGMGLANVQTFLQTGNVIFRSETLNGPALESEIEKTLAVRLGLQTDVFIRSADEWGGIVAANPFPEEARLKANYVVVMPLKTAPHDDAVTALRMAIKGPEHVEAIGAQLYISYPEGIGRSKLTIKLIESKLGTRGTGRNWNTALKIAEAVSV